MVGSPQCLQQQQHLAVWDGSRAREYLSKGWQKAFTNLFRNYISNSWLGVFFRNAAIREFSLYIYVDVPTTAFKQTHADVPFLYFSKFVFIFNCCCIDLENMSQKRSLLLTLQGALLIPHVVVSIREIISPYVTCAWVHLFSSFWLVLLVHTVQ